jgi:riboflavin kinase / FMN adenylyltransferase
MLFGAGRDAFSGSTVLSTCPPLDRICDRGIISRQRTIHARPDPPCPAPNDPNVIPLSTADAPDPRLLGGAISIGNFDGVHQGHALLIDRLRKLAGRIGGPAVAITFDPPPAAILRPEGVPPPLTTIARREALLRRCGADAVVVVKTSPELLSQSAETFFEGVVRRKLQARGMVEGPNFFFGHNREGNPHLLRRMCSQAGIECEIIDPTTAGDRMISSTRIRELLQRGQVADANELLTAPYQLAGVVVPGAGRGRTLGFPTANLNEIVTLIPGRGVYACHAAVEGAQCLAAVHIGPNPTFADTADKVEVHLLDFSGDVYGCRIELEFVSQIRQVQQFATSEALQKQLTDDIDEARRCLR